VLEQMGALVEEARRFVDPLYAVQALWHLSGEPAPARAV
jgi:hypothetical protein